jgi:hypothetical protein
MFFPQIGSSSGNASEWNDPVGATTALEKEAMVSKLCRIVFGSTAQSSPTVVDSYPDFTKRGSTELDDRSSKDLSQLSESVQSSSEPSPTPTSRFRFPSRNPLKLLYEAAKSIGRFFYQTATFVSSKMNVVGVRFAPADAIDDSKASGRQSEVRDSFISQREGSPSVRSSTVSEQEDDEEGGNAIYERAQELLEQGKLTLTEKERFDIDAISGSSKREEYAEGLQPRVDHYSPDQVTLKSRGDHLDDDALTVGVIKEHARQRYLDYFNPERRDTISPQFVVTDEQPELISSVLVKDEENQDGSHIEF